MLHVPLHRGATVSYASVAAMAAYGEPTICDTQSNCHPAEQCTRHRCTRDPRRVKWGELVASLVLIGVAVAICIGLAYRVVSATDNTWTDDYANAFEQHEDEIELLSMNITETPNTVARIEESVMTPVVVQVNTV